MEWFSMDGGGGTSTGGVYTVSGTVGQPDAGSMAGGQFAIQGGFWSVVTAVQTPGAPWLRVERSVTNTVLLAWPHPSTGFELQSAGDVSNPTWSHVSITPLVVGEEKQVIVDLPPGRRFYRLRKPGIESMR